MKTISLVIALLGSGLLTLRAQSAASTGTDRSGRSEYQISSREANSQVWQKTEWETAPDGSQIAHVHQYTEVASGLNYSVNGRYVASSETIDILPNGTAAATNGQHQAYFPGDIYEGAIELVTPDGQHLISRPMGLSYFDGTNTVLIAELTNSIGTVVGDNQVIYANAFTDFKVDLRYTYTKAGFEQDIILRQQPPTPESLGLYPDTTRLQVLTEFFNAPQPTIQARKMAPQAGLTLIDDTIGFGAMRMVPGRAFLLGKQEKAAGAKVNKHWVMLHGRQFLMEEVPVDAMLEGLAALPLTAMNSGSGKARLMAAKSLTLPKQRLASNDRSTAMLLAKNDVSVPGYVLDYQTVNTSLTNFTFQGDTTYYVSGNLNLYGTTTIEGGTVVKYDPNGPSLGVTGSLNCRTAPYHPAAFTSKNDNSVGEPIAGSTGTPAIDHSVNCYFLYVYNIGQVELHDLRMSYCYCALTVDNGNLNLSDVQFTHTDYPMYLVNVPQASVNNVLMHDVQVVAFEGFMAAINVKHLTLDGCVQLGANDWQTTLTMTNSLLVGVQSMGDIPYATNYVAQVGTNVPVFQTVGGASHYLTNNSSYRNAGTTNIDASVLADIRSKTTYPPISYTNYTFTTNGIFSPQAQRDTDTPDLGYHYDPLDYAFGGCTANSNMTFTAGTAVGWFRTTSGWYHAGQGIQMSGDITVAFDGTVTSPTYWVRLNTVQELDRTAGYGHGSIENWSGPSIPVVSGRFLRCSVMAGEVLNGYFSDDYGWIRAEMSHTEFWGGQQNTYGDQMCYTNCLFWRSGSVGVTSGDSSSSFYMVDSTMIGGIYFMQRNSGGTMPVVIRNCAFDGTTISTGSDYYGSNASYTDYDYNAYTNATVPFSIGGTHDVKSVTSFNWQSSWLGDFYLPYDSPLIDAGSTNANLLGLYQYTTQTNQVKDATSIVDIGYHYVATDGYGNPVDSNGNGSPDYLEDANGNGLVDNMETPWNLPATNLLLWLKADAILGLTNNASITNWLDLSGRANNATQTVAVNGPVYVTNALNGLPVVRFNGVNSYLNLPRFLTAATGAEALVVLKAATNTPTVNRALWGWGAIGNTAFYPNPSGQITETFGSSSSYNLGVPAQPLNQYHLYDVAGTNGSWAAWINGQLQYQAVGNTYGVYASTFCLGLGQSYYFAGDVAEVLVFNRTLAIDERNTVNAYLNGKYGLVTAVPATPTNLVAQVISTNQIGLTWNEVFNQGATVVNVERSLSSNGVYTVIAQLSAATSYVDTNLVAGTTYYYRVRAINLTQWSAYSGVAWATTLTNGTSVPLENLLLWLKADTGLEQIGTNTPINLWLDQSGRTNHATQIALANQPQWVANALNGLPVVRFNGVNSYLNLPRFLTAATGAEALVVLKAVTANKALWGWGAIGNTAFYPNPSGQITETFGSSSSYNLGVPAQPLNQYHLYDVAGTNGSWAAWINGQLQYQAVGNTYGVYASTFCLGLGQSYYFAGDVAEVLVFNRTLAIDERNTVNAYLNGKYGLVTAVPATPTNLVAQVISTNQIGLTWNEVFNQGATVVNVERSLSSNGVYTVIAQLSAATSYVDTNLVAGTTYYYRVRAINLTQWSAYSGVAWATTLTNGTSVPLENLLLWLKADTGLEQIGTNTPINLWLDQSGRTNHATQIALANQPQWVANALNGLPVVRFNGVNSYLNLPRFLTAATGAEALVVLKAVTANKALWGWGTLANTAFYPNPSGQITETFGSSSSYNLGVPAQPLNQYHLYDVAGTNGSWAAWINGQLQYQAVGNTYGVYASTFCLGLGQGYYFAGDVAEVLVFNRTLAIDERNTVNAYLNGKYGLVTAVPATPTNLVAQVISTNQIGLTWNEVFNQGATVVNVERSLSSNGVYTVIAQLSAATSYVDTNLVAGTTYYYRVRAINLTQWSAYSGVAWATTLTNGTSVPLENLLLWLKADTGLEQIGTNTPINLWLDQSGRTNHATQIALANQPQWVANALNGLPVVRFNGVNSYLNLPRFLTAATGAEALVVLKAVTANKALWGWGTLANTAFYPNPSGQITETFGSSSSYNLGVPAQPLNQYHLYDVAGTNGSWAAWINGQLQYQAVGNTYGVYASTFCLGLGQGYYFAGDVAEVLVFNRTLAIDERNTVNAYLNGKYGLVTAVPATPTNLVAQVISTNQIGLTWNEVFNQGATVVNVERSLSSNGVYTVIAQLSAATSYVDTNLVAGTTYYYRVRAINLTQWSAYSGVAWATTLTNGTSVPLENLLLWLKADTGLEQIGTNTPINLWLDQSGRTNHATQIALANQPQWVANALNGLPVVRFNGVNSYLNLPRFLTAATGAEALVVLKAATNTPTVNRALWGWGALYNSAFYPNPSGQITETFGSSSSYNLGVPAQPLNQYHLYDVAGTNGSWAAWINGQLQYQAVGNTYAVCDTLRLGLGQGYYFAGDVAEVLVFNRTLTIDEQNTVGNYLASKYNLSAYAINATSPAAPTNFVAIGMAPGRLNLKWNLASTNIHSIHIKRKLGGGGAYQELGTFLANVTNYVDTTASPTNQNFYQLTLNSLFGDTNSTVISPPSVSLTNWPAITIPGATNLLEAQAVDADGTVSNVQFFLTPHSLATITSAPYVFSWIVQVIPSSRTLAVLAADDQGNSQYSDPKTVVISTDVNGDGIPDVMQVQNGNDPLSPWLPPSGDTNSTPPIINLLVPANATLLP